MVVHSSLVHMHAFTFNLTGQSVIQNAQVLEQHEACQCVSVQGMTIGSKVITMNGAQLANTIQQHALMCMGRGSIPKETLLEALQQKLVGIVCLTVQIQYIPQIVSKCSLFS